MNHELLSIAGHDPALAGENHHAQGIRWLGNDVAKLNNWGFLLRQKWGVLLQQRQRETTEAFLDGHVSAFAFLGGIPRLILYDNTTLAGAADHGRRRATAHPGLAEVLPGLVSPRRSKRRN